MTKLRSVKIPIGFLLTGICWALFSDRAISLLTVRLSSYAQDVCRGINDLAFICVIAVILYFQIKRQHRLLSKSEEQYRKLFELNPSPMWIYHTGTLHFVKVNEAAVEIYGYSQQEFLGMTIKDIRPQNEVEKLVESLKSLEAEVRTPSNWKHLKKGGEVLHVSIVSYNLEFNGKPCRLVIATNITELIKHQEKINEQNRILHEIAWSNSHEVRRALCSVISLVDLLKNAENAEDRVECINLLERSSKEIDEMLKAANKKVDTLQNVQQYNNTA